MIKMVVFDMAGTTVNENNLVYKTLQQAINQYGFSVSLHQVLLEGAGKEKLEAIKSILRVYGNTENIELENEIFRTFKKLLEIAYNTNEVTGQDNAEKVFMELQKRKILIILNTGYNYETASLLLDKLNWKQGDTFNGLITASDVKNNRPEPDMILKAFKDFNIVYPEEVIKVGDSTIDIEEGRNAGCKVNIGITTGAHTRSELQTAHPNFIIDNLIELLPIIDQLNSI